MNALIRKAYTVASRSDILAAREELNFQNKTTWTSGDAAEFGRMLNVSAIIVVTINKFDTTEVRRQKSAPSFSDPLAVVDAIAYKTTASVSARLIDVSKVQVLWQGSHEGQEESWDRGDDHKILAAVAKELAKEFPSRSR